MTLFQEQAELLESYRRGEPAALERVYRHYVRDVLTLLRAGFVNQDGSRVPPLAHSSDQLDLLQEVFVRAFSEAARLRYDGERPYRPYLLQIAKNLRIDQLRTQRRWSQPNMSQAGEDADEAADPGSAGVTSGSSQAEREWQRLHSATRDFTASLAEPLGRFVTLRFEEAHSQADVAEIMGTTRRQVRTWEDQVQADLKRFLKARQLI